MIRGMIEWRWMTGRVFELYLTTNLGPRETDKDTGKRGKT